MKPLPKVRRTIIIEYFKHIVSSVGLRKRMTVMLTSWFIFTCDSCILWLRFDCDVCFDVLSCFFDHPSIDSSQKMPLHPFEKDVLMFRLIKKVLSVDVTEQHPLNGPGANGIHEELLEQKNKTQMNRCPISQLLQNIGENNRIHV